MTSDYLAKKNGEVELLRIIFATIVMIHHFADSFGIAIAENGGIADEFFFTITGILMAKGVKGRIVERKKIPNTNWKHLLRKISVFYPYYFFALILQILLLFVIDKLTVLQVLERVFASVPEIILLNMNGIYYNNGIFVGGGWFLSAMIMAIFFLYPVLLFNYEYATKLVFPCIGIIGLGNLFVAYHTINAVLPINHILLSGVIRAMAEISLGAFGFEVACKIDKSHFLQRFRFIPSAFKCFCFAIVAIFALGKFDNSLTPVAYFFCLIGCILSFSNTTFSIPCNRIVYIIGRISVPLYLTHCIVRKIAVAFLGSIINTSQFVLCLVVCFIVAFFSMCMIDYFKRRIKLLCNNLSFPISCTINSLP